MWIPGTEEPSSYGGGSSSGTGGCCGGVDVEGNAEGAVGIDTDDSPILACGEWFRPGIPGDPSPGGWLWDCVNTCPSTGRTWTVVLEPATGTVFPVDGVF